jgi:hypothetical protein
MTIERRRLSYQIYCKYPMWIWQDVINPTDLERVIGQWLKKHKNREWLEETYQYCDGNDAGDNADTFQSFFGGEMLVHLPVETLIKCLN